MQCVPMLLFIYYYGQIAPELKIQFDWFERMGLGNEKSIAEKDKERKRVSLTIALKKDIKWFIIHLMGS